MQETPIPTVTQIINGLDRFNAWERDERREVLGQLTVEASLRQFFELCDLVREWRPEPHVARVFTAHKHAGWSELQRRLRPNSLTF